MISSYMGVLWGGELRLNFTPHSHALPRRSQNVATKSQGKSL